MLLWNSGTTWWIWNSTAAGAVGAIIANSLLMCLPLLGYYACRKQYGKTAAFISFPAFWMAFEYIHLNWQLSWPWLTLGNVFATKTAWVQWYEYTGVQGGSLWVLLANLAVYNVVTANKFKYKIYLFVWAAVIIGFPFYWSVVAADNYTKSNSVGASNTNNIVIVQPNIDPYSEKFDVSSTYGQIEKLVRLSEQELDSNTRMVLWPETAMPVAEWQDRIQHNNYYSPVFNFVQRHPDITLQTGIETYKNYGSVKATGTARRIEDRQIFFDAFNAATTIKANESLQFYNKSKLVPGVETLPAFLYWLAAIFEKFGGTTGGYGYDAEASVFKITGSPYISAPIICYESIYGEYVTTYVKKGANIITIMTNDGWWANTPGHKQHLAYARLRAIETRRWIARSANTGISAVIDANGNVVKSKPWDVASTLKFAIPPAVTTTFYVEHGDYLFQIAVYLSIILIIYHIYMFYVARLRRRHQLK